MIVLLIGVIPENCVAQNAEIITYFSDGSYMVETLTVYSTRAAGSISGNKVKTWYDSDGNMAWSATLTGSFTYTGSSSTCTSASTSVSDSSWYTVSKSASKNGAVASASVTMGRKALGVTVEKKTVSLALTCDANGNLS